MNKFEFLTQLRAKLWSIPQEDAQRSVEYYREMIEDRMEEGLTEEEAVAAVGDLEEIVKTILAETPQIPVPVKAPEKPGLRWWEITLLILGSPIWASLLIAAVSVVFSLWISLWAVVISLYATAVSLGAAAIGCIAGSFFMFQNGAGTVMVAWGAALVCAGLAILFVMLSNLAAKGMVKLTGLCVQGVKGIFQRKERTV